MMYVGKNSSTISLKNDINLLSMNQSSTSDKKLHMTECPTPTSLEITAWAFGIINIEH